MTKVIQSQRANCKNCYKCLRVCPVKSIRFSSGQAELMPESCIYCGACVEECPQQAKVVLNQVEKVKDMLRSGDPVVVSLAPSFLGAFPMENPMRMVGALKALGFTHVRETAEGAALISDAFAGLAKEGKMDNIITTCCPVVNNLIEKHYPELTGVLAPVVTPMIAHGRLIKEQQPGAKVVFVGPCIAKMDESMDIRHDTAIDAVVTFNDLTAWFEEVGVHPTQSQPMPFDGEDGGLSKMYPTHAGILRNMRVRGVTNYKLLQVEGIQDCMDLFRALAEDQLHGCLVEVSACRGSCMGGPALPQHKSSRFIGGIQVKEYAKDCPEEVPQIHAQVPLHKEFLNLSKPGAQPTEEQINTILRSIGKESKLDELNCGSCGYPTCRAKAVAVFQHKAEASMCMPYMFQAAQSMSNVVMDNTPNVILVLDEDMKLVELNAAGQKLFSVTHAEAKDRYLYEFMAADDFEYVLESHKSITDKRVSLDEYGIAVDQSIVYLPKQHGVLGILRDITGEQTREQALYQLRLDTMNMAQKVIDKQMVAAQEIASLLGETTAETKSTLTSLKNMIIGNGERKV